jgi:hypothetical protein
MKTWDGFPTSGDAYGVRRQLTAGGAHRKRQPTLQFFYLQLHRMALNDNDEFWWTFMLLF